MLLRGTFPNSDSIIVYTILTLFIIHFTQMIKALKNNQESFFNSQTIDPFQFSTSADLSIL